MSHAFAALKARLLHCTALDELRRAAAAMAGEVAALDDSEAQLLAAALSSHAVAISVSRCTPPAACTLLRPSGAAPGCAVFCGAGRGWGRVFAGWLFQLCAA